jgi:omega-6 fatty acid desaturase (delta-12 desaturase)
MDRQVSPVSWLTRARYVELARRRTVLPLLIIGRDVLLYIASLGLAIAPIPLPFRICASVWAGIMIGGIFVAGHDACHQALTPHRSLNDWIARLTMAPAWTSASLWKHFHNRVHHGFTNIIGVDYAWSPISLATWRSYGPVCRIIYRLYRSPMGCLPYYLIEMWWKCHFLPIAPDLREGWQKYAPDAAFALLWQVGLIVLLLTAGAAINPGASVLGLLLLGWLLPYLVWNALIGIVTYAHHTHPDVGWYTVPGETGSAEAQVIGTVHATLPQPLKILSSNIMEHNAHHVVPTLPHYHLADAQRELSLCFPSIVRLTMHSRQMLAVIAACKVYDTEQHCWVNYTGQPTGPIHLPHMDASLLARR